MTNISTFIRIFIFLYSSILEISASSDIKVYEFTRNSSLSFPGKVLVGHVFAEFSTKRQVIHCAFECLKSKRCKSFNYELNDFTCQLNDATHEDFNSSLHDEDNGKRNEYHLREAFAIDLEALGPCALEPCQHGARCLDTMNARMERSYYCVCTEGWQGVNCEYEMNRIDWDVWEDWGPCSKTCEIGWTTRRRKCIDTVTSEAVSPSKCFGRDVEYQECTLQQCPRWNQWEDWGPCSTENTCGKGVKVRERSCSDGGIPGVDRFCLGFTNETAPCKGIDCRGLLYMRDGDLYGEGRIEILNDLDRRVMPVCADDGWNITVADIVCRQMGFEGAYGDGANNTYGPPDMNGDSVIKRIRCEGSEKTLQACRRETVTTCDRYAAVQCKVRGSWSLWTGWGDCSVTCENGTRTRTRECNHPPPNFAGTPCPGDEIQYKPCQLSMCPTLHVFKKVQVGNDQEKAQSERKSHPKNQGPGVWESWGSWSECDVTCGEGIRERFRLCLDENPCLGTNVTYDICRRYPCDVDGVWEDWTSWSACDVTCANGTRFRTRYCKGPFYGGAECPGPDEEIEECFPRMCEVDGIWNEWSLWTDCSHTCGYGSRNRSRTCYGPFYGGLECPGSPDEVETCNAFSCPVDGSWKLWSEWGECSVTCGGGLRNRTRDCNDPRHGGAGCVGPSEQAESCNEHACPIDGIFTEWVQWSHCSVTCANGTRFRTRECVGPFFGGSNCTGPWEEEEICQSASCPVDGVWNDWQGWESCNVTCGGGAQIRQRVCHGPFYGGAECVGPEIDSRECNMHECPIDGVWLEWSEWDSCSVTCGGGSQNRSRVCLGPFHGGAECPGPEHEQQDCNTHSCPVDGEWNSWESWSECSMSCGGGTATRQRECHQPLHGGMDCMGEGKETMECNMHECPVDGVWSSWTNWTECTLTCGSGSQERNRTCDGPYYGGANCSGDSVEIRDCNTHNCPIDGIFTEWTDWSPCSHTCGRGSTERNRSCVGPFFGGQECEGETHETKYCYPSSCPVHGIWFSWSQWTDCSTTCENGTRTRNRTCDGPYFGGDECAGSADEVEECFLRWCPVDGVWDQWSDWDQCPVTCGGTIQNRSRVCIGPEYGGANCSGAWEESRECGTMPCPVDGEWSLWSGWSVCNVTCGGGTSGRHRICSETQHGGSNCTGPDEEYKSCNEHECPIDGVWESWSNWTECSLSCGTGDRQRYRDCDGPFYGGANCSGPAEESETCNTHECPIDGVWESWAEWSSCNVTCGGGTRWRSRDCYGPFYGGAECPGSNISSEDCNTHECPIDGIWQQWASWEECSVTCGGGNQTRVRDCTGPFFGGANCSGLWDETRECNTFECPIDGVLTSWSGFYACDVTCGGGIQWRNRTCEGPFYGGANCTEPLEESRICNTFECPIDGVWISWSQWGQCDVTCGGGIQFRNRSCDGPYYDGADCVGEDLQNQTCNDFNCPVDGVWHQWSDWDECSVTCGGSTHHRYRVCEGPFYGGANCSGPAVEEQPCSIHECPVDGVFTSWSAWEDCDVTCGGGIQWRNRSCHGPFYGGADCEGAFNDSQVCNTLNCPIDGVWEAWGSWGECDVTCGGGLRLRNRTCDGPFYDGADCEGSDTDSEECGLEPCPIPGLWNAWTPWSLCSQTCGGGLRYRNRTCDMESFGNLTIDCEGEPEDYMDCHTFSCEPLAIHCADWASRGLNQSCEALIDPDGEEYMFGPELVECDFDSSPGLALTILHHDSENRTHVKGFEGAGEYQVVINYDIGWAGAIKVIDSSAACSQFMRWECFAAIIHNPYDPDMLTTFWYNRTEQMANYFGGGSPERGNCACGETNSCANSSLPCNCDKNDEVWRVDEGWVTNKAELPIHSFYAGDTGGTIEDGYRYIGPVICSGFH